jgi:hypothetical protein
MRIWARRSILIAAAAMAASRAFAQEQPTPFPTAGAGLGRVQGNVTLANPLQWMAPVVTVVGNRWSDRVEITYSLLFDRMIAMLVPATPAQDAQAAGIFALILPDVSAVKASRLDVAADLRGFALAGEGGRASLAVSLLGGYQTFLFENQEAGGEDYLRSIETGRAVPEGKVRAKAIDLGCYLTVSRAVPSEQSELTLDSVDLRLTLRA